ncbi:hypothetical protein BS47DRAFT_1394076 [Hydnum rufescens UP504]|uniref:Uncharacterized protein n=1 Tax=Hydnum rufescens UP504 TaxID=1448309 RepID=A0A9P6AVE2_9AGAM|nr:hypothetical protein BS47DRAFT_1394076 [Hydnum rufescens UP504]
MILDAAKSSALPKVPDDNDSLPTFEEAIAGPSTTSINLSSLSSTNKPHRDAITTSDSNASFSSPPEFSTWDAEYSVTSSGDIVSHDAHLNEDGEALYRFLLTQLHPPTFRLHLNGVHEESRTRVITTINNGEERTKTEVDTVRVTDFDFNIDLSYILKRHSTPEIWTLDDLNPGYRGEMYKQVMRSPDPETEDIAPATPSRWAWLTGRRPQGGPIRLIEEGEGMRVFLRGYDIQKDSLNISLGDRRPMKSKLTPRQWADDYCASNKTLKELFMVGTLLNYEKPFTTSSGPLAITGVSSVTFETTANNIYIRPDTPLSRALSNVWIKVILWVLLIYPFVWLFRRFHEQGGGRWKVCGAAYALNRTAPMPPRTATDGTALPDWAVPLEAGPFGVREGEWFKAWEGTIKNAVLTGTQRSQPLRLPGVPLDVR